MTFLISEEEKKTSIIICSTGAHNKPLMESRPYNTQSIIFFPTTRLARVFAHKRGLNYEIKLLYKIPQAITLT